MSEAKMKPCPFCGGKARVVKWHDWYYVKCDNLLLGCCYTIEVENRKKAIETWNRRSSEVK